MQWDKEADTVQPKSDFDTTVARRIPLDSDPADLYQYLQDVVRACNWHRHTDTCKKGRRAGDHSDCRMNFDLPLVPESCRLADATFAVKRTDGMLVQYIPALMLACPANHLMQFTFEGSRWLRSFMLWRDACLKSPDKVCSHGGWRLRLRWRWLS
jgi:hypothetical protein